MKFAEQDKNIDIEAKSNYKDKTTNENGNSDGDTIALRVNAKLISIHDYAGKMKSENVIKFFNNNICFQQCLKQYNSQEIIVSAIKMAQINNHPKFFLVFVESITQMCHSLTSIFQEQHHLLLLVIFFPFDIK